MSIEDPINNPPQEAPKPVENKRGSTPEEEDQYRQWMKDHPETVIAPEDLRECGPEIAELEELLASFELTHFLEELHLIIDLKPEDVSKYPVRESAKAALIPIVSKLNSLKGETNISPEKHAELKAKYRKLSRAVGMINNNKVDHHR